MGVGRGLEVNETQCVDQGAQMMSSEAPPPLSSVFSDVAIFLHLVIVFACNYPFYC